SRLSAAGGPGPPAREKRRAADGLRQGCRGPFCFWGEQMETQVYLFDTTLRDGTQSEGLSLSVDDKLKIAGLLDGFGVHYVEGGWPGSNPKDAEFFRRARSLALRHAKLVAFGATRKAGVRAEEGPNLRALLAAETPAVSLFGKSCTLHDRHVLEATPEATLAMRADSPPL